MAAETRTPRTEWVQAGLRALAAGGPDAVRVEALAKSLGVTKGGFYGYFADRKALMAEMLDTWERECVDDLLARVEREGGEVEARMRRAGALASSERLLSVDLAVRDWARRDRSVADRLRRVDNRRMEYLRSLFRERYDDEREIEARCMLAFSLLVGNHFLAADHGALTREEVYELAVQLIRT
ncbi:helix-turn-helix domain-containing protein [Streptomyces sp. PmtG]